MDEKLEQIIFAGLGALFGALWGTLDCLTTGLPYVTIGMPVWEGIKFFDAQYSLPNFGEKITLLEYCKKLIPYGLGANIPFAIKYHKEIVDFISQMFT